MFGALFVGWIDGELAFKGKDYSFSSDSIPGDSGVYSVLTGVPGRATDWRDHALGAWVIGPDTWSLQELSFAGDFDGDGFDDVWLQTSHFVYDNAELLLLRGPAADWPGDGQYADEVVAPTWPEDGERMFLELYPGSSADIDGDGMVDLTTAMHDYYEVPGTVAVLFGQSDLSNQEYRIEDGVWFGNSLQIERIFPGPDADGDGLLDLLRISSDHALWTPGDLLRTSVGSDIADIGTLVYLATSDDEINGDGSNPTIGDLNSDGSDDAVAAHYHASDDTLCASFLDMSAVPTAANLDDAILAEACAPMDAAVNHTGNVISDLDGDGVTDVTVDGDADNDDWGAHGRSGDLRCVVPSHRLALGGRVEVRDVGLCYHGLYSVIPDINEDGFADMIGLNVEEYESDPDEYGRTDILLGWDIPWDDPTKW